MNFLILPFFTLDKHPDPGEQIAFKAEVEKEGKVYEMEWIVMPQQGFGIPGDFERRVQRTVEYIVTTMCKPIKNPVPIRGFRAFARLMGRAYSGKFVKAVKQALRRMTVTSVISKKAFYHKRKKAWMEEVFHLYEKVVFVGEELADGTTAERNYVYLNGLYLDNLNAMYVRPLDFQYLKSLRPIPSRLYELLGVKFYGHEKYILYRYSTLTQLLPVKRQRYLSLVRQQLDPAHRDLIKTGFLSRYEWLPMSEEVIDWQIRYRPGPRYFEETNAVGKDSIAPAERQLIEAPQGRVRALTILEKQANDANEEPTENLFAGFAEIVKRHPEFDLVPLKDREWFKARIEENTDYRVLNLQGEIAAWGDWLEMEHRRKMRQRGSKFPRSNFRGSLTNWLKKALSIHGKGEPYGGCERKTGRKGFDLASDYPTDG